MFSVKNSLRCPWRICSEDIINLNWGFKVRRFVVKPWFHSFWVCGFGKSVNISEHQHSQLWVGIIIKFSLPTWWLWGLFLLTFSKYWVYHVMSTVLHPGSNKQNTSESTWKPYVLCILIIINIIWVWYLFDRLGPKDFWNQVVFPKIHFTIQIFLTLMNFLVKKHVIVEDLEMLN